MIRVIVAVLFIILVATFSALNREEIFLRYFFGWSTGSFPLFLLILISLVAGMVLGFSVDWGERRKLRNKARRLGVQVKQLRKEIETLTEEKTPPSLLPPSQKPQKQPHDKAIQRLEPKKACLTKPFSSSITLNHSSTPGSS